MLFRSTVVHASDLPWRLSLEGSLSKPVARFGDLSDNGNHFNVSIDRELLPELLVGVDVGRHAWNANDSWNNQVSIAKSLQVDPTFRPLVDTPIVSVFIESFAPPPQMWIFGAVDFTAALAKVAKLLGYRVVVCDAREIFATRRRFPMADEVVVSWPGRLFDERGNTLTPRDAVCILTHDPKFDVPAVQGALASAAGYIGVMGSRKTHSKRLERLAEVGVSDPADLSRLMSPIGLDLGARTPEETAVSICAEIIARRTGRIAPSLRDSSGPIH